MTPDPRVPFFSLFPLTFSSPIRLDWTERNHFRETFRESQTKESDIVVAKLSLLWNLWIQTHVLSGFSCFRNKTKLIWLSPFPPSFLPSSFSYMHFLSSHSHSLPSAIQPLSYRPISFTRTLFCLSLSRSLPPFSLSPIRSPFPISYRFYSGNDTDTLRYSWTAEAGTVGRDERGSGDCRPLRFCQHNNNKAASRV